MITTATDNTETSFPKDLFEVVIAYHIDKNLRAGLENEVVVDGQMQLMNGKGRKPVVLGEENGQNWYRRLFLVANGKDIAATLQEHEVIPKTARVSYQNVPNAQSLHDYLDIATTKDGAVILDRESRRVTRQRLNPNAPSLESIVTEDCLPIDFITEDCSIELSGEDGSNVGCRTDAGYKVSRGLNTDDGYHPIESFLIKGTAYNPLGFGSAARMSAEQIETFHFRYAPQAEGSFLDEEHNIIGVLRNYSPDEAGRYTLVHEEQVHLNQDNRLCYSCGDNSGQLVYQDRTV